MYFLWCINTSVLKYIKKTKTYQILYACTATHKYISFLSVQSICLQEKGLVAEGLRSLTYSNRKVCSQQTVSGFQLISPHPPDVFLLQPMTRKTIV